MNNQYLTLRGFMRKEESSKVKTALNSIGLDLVVVNASERFYSATTTINGKETKPLNLTGHPEEKRKIVGDTFMKVTEEEIRKLNLDPDQIFIAQGTLRPGTVRIDFTQE